MCTLDDSIVLGPQVGKDNIILPQATGGALVILQICFSYILLAQHFHLTDCTVSITSTK